MKVYQTNFYDQVEAAIKAGDRRQLADLYRQQGSLYGANLHSREISMNMLEATTNAAKQDPAKLQRNLALEVLCLQGTLLHRADEAIRLGIERHDKEYRGAQPWGCLPDEIAKEWLPRYAKLSTEMFKTIKLLQRLDTEPLAKAQQATNA